MRITDFTVRVAELEGKKKEVNIAQIREIVRIINQLTEGALYKAIRKMEV